MPRIINSYFILIGGLGITLFNIYCYIENVWSFAYTKGQFLFLGICLCLSYAFPHSVEKVKQRDERHQIRMEKMREKIEQQRTSSMRRKILGEDFKK